MQKNNKIKCKNNRKKKLTFIIMLLIVFASLLMPQCIFAAEKISVTTNNGTLNSSDIDGYERNIVTNHLYYHYTDSNGNKKILDYGDAEDNSNGTGETIIYVWKIKEGSNAWQQAVNDGLTDISTEITYTSSEGYDTYVKGSGLITGGNVGKVSQTKNGEVVSTVENGGVKLENTNSNSGIFGNLLDGAVGIFLMIPKFLLLIIGGVLGKLMGLFSGDGFLTLEDILFNKITVTDIDFFNLNSSDETINTIRANVAAWYVGIRNVAVVALLLILIYVGIRMAISTVAEEKAHYKEMLLNWFTSLCVLFALHFIILLTIQANNVVVSTLYNAYKNGGSTVDNSKDISSQFLHQSIYTLKATVGLSNAVCYLGIEALTFAFLVSYLKRMITIAFLIIIAPLVTITYSVDKMGDGKSQALNTWFKEFAFNVWIQPFHCVAYLALCTSAVDAANDGNLRSGFIAICLMYFLAKSAEEIVKNIFGIKANSMPSPAASAAVGAALVSTTHKVASKISGAKSGNKAPDIPTSQTTTQSRTAQQNMNGAVGGAQGGNAQGAGNTSGGAAAGGAGAVAGAAVGNGSQGGNAQAAVSRNPYGFESKVSKPSKAGTNAFRIWAKTNAVTAGALAGIGFATAQGDANSAIAGAAMGGEIGAGAGTGINKKANEGYYRRNAARAFNNYKAATGMTDEEISSRAMALLRGDEVIDPESEFADEDRDLMDSMADLTNYYRREGESEKDSIKDTSKVLDDIKAGKQGEETRRYTGEIKKKYYSIQKNRYNSMAEGTDDVELKREYQQKSQEFDNKIKQTQFREDLSSHKVDMDSKYGNTNNPNQNQNPNPQQGQGSNQ